MVLKSGQRKHMLLLFQFSSIVVFFLVKEYGKGNLLHPKELYISTPPKRLLKSLSCNMFIY
jgi:hypothetical protein